MTAEDVKRLLKLERLPMEGGYFRETYRSRCRVSSEYLPEGISSSRPIGTAIYYMVTPESYSRLHRLPGSEVFHFYLGDPVTLLQLFPDRTSTKVTMSNQLELGHQLQVIVRGGTWQGCKLCPGGKWALLGTTMSPGFDYADYEAADREQLLSQYPDAQEEIREYTV